MTRRYNLSANTRWRPKSPKDLGGSLTIGQFIDGVPRSPVLVLYGPKGVGKTSWARVYSKEVNCESLIAMRPCLQCRTCNIIQAGTALDIHEIDGASHNGVEDVRKIQQEAHLSPTSLKYKVFIIDECHMLSSGAFNALLKILEEPPPRIIFILVTTELHKVPKTIVSRCQRIQFSKIPRPVIEERIKFIAGEEKIQITPEAIKQISAVSDGSMRDAIILLEQSASIRRPEEEHNLPITKEFIREIIGASSQQELEDLACIIAAKNLKPGIEKLRFVLGGASSPIRVSEELLGFFRSVFLYKILEKYPEELAYTEESIDKVSRIINLNETLEIFEALKGAFLDMNKTPIPEAELELAIIKLCSKSEGFALKTENKPNQFVGSGESLFSQQTKSQPPTARALEIKNKISHVSSSSEEAIEGQENSTDKMIREVKNKISHLSSSSEEAAEVQENLTDKMIRSESKLDSKKILGVDAENKEKSNLSTRSDKAIEENFTANKNLADIEGKAKLTEESGSIDWQAALLKLKNVSRPAYFYLENSWVKVSGNLLIIYLTKAIDLKVFGPTIKREIKQIVLEFTGIEYRIDLEVVLPVPSEPNDKIAEKSGRLESLLIDAKDSGIDIK